MNKKLKIQFWKTHKSLSMSIMEQKGLPRLKETGRIRIKSAPYLDLGLVYLRGSYWDSDFHVVSKTFNCDLERDLYLERAVNAITDELFTDELFTGEGELKIGEMCEVSDNGECWTNRGLLAVLPKKYEMRYITTGNGLADHFSWRYARPLPKRTEPTVEECGQLITYTWEEK